jgi:hypothetical protein
MTKMTAVEWLVQQIDNKDMGEIPMWVYDLCYDAQEMEKEQIIDAFQYKFLHPYVENEPETYYNETYKKP